MAYRGAVSFYFQSVELLLERYEIYFRESVYATADYTKAKRIRIFIFAAGNRIWVNCSGLGEILSYQHIFSYWFQ